MHPCYAYFFAEPVIIPKTIETLFAMNVIPSATNVPEMKMETMSSYPYEMNSIA